MAQHGPAPGRVFHQNVGKPTLASAHAQQVYFYGLRTQRAFMQISIVIRSSCSHIPGSQAPFSGRKHSGSHLAAELKLSRYRIGFAVA